MSILKPSESVGTGLAVAALAYAVYSKALPPQADMRTIDAGNTDLDAARKTASWSAVGAVALVSLLTKDATVFILGGAAVVALDWQARHAIEVSPFTGKASTVWNAVSDNAAMTDAPADGE